MEGRIKRAWKLWALSLGERPNDSERDSDIVASIRTVIALINITACILIILNILSGWI